MNNKEIINSLLQMNFDIDSFIMDGFSYYKNNSDEIFNNPQYINLLLNVYYDLNYDKTEFNTMKKSFIRKYIFNESEVEGVDIAHEKEEVDGLKEMYMFMHTEEFDKDFDIFSLKTLHEKLFSCTPYPEFGGNFRSSHAYLDGAKTNLCDWSYIFLSLRDLDSEVTEIKEMASTIKDSHDAKMILYYFDKCIELSCKLIKIHPFADGNGRTIRCFTNKLFEDAGLPSVYIKVDEKSKYLSAMQKALDLEDYSEINSFYRFKLCDSIIELDINERRKKKSIEKNKEYKK